MKRPRLFYNCRRGYCCTNVKFTKITNFGINQLEFQPKEGVIICSLCGEEAAYLSCKGRLILDKDTEKKIGTAKDDGMDSFPTEVKIRSKDVSKTVKELPCLTRGTMVRQKVQQQLKQSSFYATVTTAKSYTDKTYINNIKIKQRFKRKIHT